MDDLEVARSLVEAALGVRFNAHESSYRGGEYYKFDGLGLEEIILQRNFDPIENEYCEEEAAEYPILLYVSGSARSSEIEGLLRKSISSIALVSRRPI